MTYQPGDILLNKYRIEKLLGEGACAKVYLATHKRLKALRALKILRKDAPGLGSTDIDEFRLRFQLEAQLGAKLGEHPHLIQVHDFEQDQDILILVMEYASGGSLAERIKKARDCDELILIDEVLQIGLDVARGLSAIHALDAVHRDLKPSNILFDKKGRAKVADVGLAQIPGGPSMRSQLSTGVPHPGTPAYMSSEQKSISNYLTPASDVYALGLVLFEALTGRVYRSQKPGTQSKELRGEVPNWLDKLLTRMLSKTPEERPWGGSEVVELLENGIKLEEEKRQAEQDRRKAAAQARREAEDKARREAEERAQHQAAERNRLEKDAKKAIRAESWGQASDLINQIKSMGTEGQRKAEELQEQLTQAKVAAEQSEAARIKKEAQEIARLEQRIERALTNENWSAAKAILAELKTLGPRGQAKVNRYQNFLPQLWNLIPPWSLEKISAIKYIVNSKNKIQAILYSKNKFSVNLQMIIALVLFFSIGFALSSTQKFFSYPTLQWEETLSTVEAIQALPEASPVLVAFDYEPALSGEMNAIAAGIVDHLMLTGAYLTFVSTSPTGPVLVENFLKTVQAEHNYVHGQQYVNLGYIPGETAGLLSFVISPQNIMPLAFDGADAWKMQPLQDIVAVADFSMVLVITDASDTARMWIEQVQPNLEDTPLMMAVSAQAEPLVRPYYEATPRQVTGLVSGLPGGASYEQIIGRGSLANEYWSTYNVGIMVTVVVLLVSSIVNVFSSQLDRKRSHAGEDR